MLAKTLCSLGLIALTTAFRVPQNTTDGFYRAYYNAAGEEVHELVKPGDLDPANNPPIRPSMASPNIRKRASMWCGCTHGMDHDDTDHANGDLQNNVRSGGVVSPNGAIYVSDGSTVAFFCNKDSFSAQVFSGNGVIGAQKVTASCGYYIAGTWRMDNFAALDFGYMSSGQDFCHNAEISGQHGC